MSKRDVLSGITFGKRIAEDQADALASYFVETEQWRKVISGDVDIIYGPKGSGKSCTSPLSGALPAKISTVEQFESALRGGAN